ncbi:MAG: DUF4860 domain-containing protein [Oscillospiraceae bacterium]
MKLTVKTSSHVVDLLFTLALFCVFTATSLMVVLIGANVYKSTVSGMSKNFDMRTSLTYLSEKVRQNDVADGVHLADLDGKTALVLEQNFNDTSYQTWIYYDDSSLKELFTKKGNDISIADGREIMKTSDFKIECSPEGIFSFTTISKTGESATAKVSPRC